MGSKNSNNNDDASGTTYATTTTTQKPPDWVTSAYKNLFGDVQSLANRSYTPYTGGYTSDQTAAFQGIRNLQGAANGYFADANKYQDQGAGLVNGAGKYFASANGLYDLGKGAIAKSGTAFDRAQAQTGLASGAFGDAAAAYNRAMRPAYESVGSFMSPYISNVVDASMANMQEMNARQQQNVIGNAAAKGALGGNRLGVAQSELSRQQSLANNQSISDLWRGAYDNALSAAQQQQAFGLQGAGGLVGVGQGYLGAGQNYLGAGQGYLDQGAGYNNTAAGVAGLGNAQIGQGQALSGIGAQQAGLGQSYMDTNLQQLAARLGAGTQQQQFDYQQYLNKLAFPYQQQSWAAGLLGGVGPNAGGTTSQRTPQGNIWSQLLGAVTGIGSMFADGGVVRPHYAVGGPTPYANDNGDWPGMSFDLTPYASNQNTPYASYIPEAGETPYTRASYPGIQDYEIEDPLADIWDKDSTKKTVRGLASWIDGTFAGGGVVRERAKGRPVSTNIEDRRVNIDKLIDDIFAGLSGNDNNLMPPQPPRRRVNASYYDPPSVYYAHGGVVAPRPAFAGGGTPRVSQQQSKLAKTRRADLDPKLVTLLEDVGARNNVYFEVYSGGQNDETGYTGSVRHDHGNAADLRAYQVDENGTKHYITTDTPGGQALWKNIASSSIALGATGVGMAEGYMGSDRMHIGFGGEANHGRPASSASTLVWGDGGKTANAPAWLVSARDEGLGFRKNGIPRPSADIPGSTSVASYTDTADIGGLQRNLAAKGFNPGPIDGINGPQTKAAVKAFQKANGLTPDGIVGPKTMAALDRQNTGFTNLPSDAMYGVNRLPTAPGTPVDYDPFALKSNVGSVADTRTLGLINPQRSTIDPVGAGPSYSALRNMMPASGGVVGNAPTPMPGRPAALDTFKTAPAIRTAPPSSPAPSAAPAAEMVRLPSGKMAKVGTYTNPDTGNLITVSRGANGMGTVSINRSGIVNLGREMNAPTVVGGLIRSKVPEAVDTAVSNFAPAIDNVKSSAVNAINTAVPMVQNTAHGLVNNVGGFFGGLFGGAPAPAPGPTGSAFTGGWGSKPAAPAPVRSIAPTPFTASPMLRAQSAPAPKPIKPRETFDQVWAEAKGYDHGGVVRGHYDSGGLVPYTTGDQFVTEQAPGYSQNAGDALKSLFAGNGLNLAPDMRHAMLSAGAGMMASRSPFALQGIGEGVLKGVQAWEDRQQLERENALARSNIANTSAVTQAQLPLYEAQTAAARYVTRPTPVGMQVFDLLKPDDVQIIPWGGKLPDGQVATPPADLSEEGSFSPIFDTTPPPPTGYDTRLLSPETTPIVTTETSNSLEDARTRNQSATGAQQQLQEMRHQIDQLPDEGWLTPGTDFTNRLYTAKAINTGMAMLGMNPVIDEKQVAAGEDLNKLTTRLGFELSNGVGSSAATIVTDAVAAVPGGANTKEGAEVILNALEAVNRRNIDRYNAMQQWSADPNRAGSLLGFEEWFNTTNPPELYALSAYVPEPAMQYLRQHPDQASAFNHKYGHGRNVAQFVLAGASGG